MTRNEAVAILLHNDPVYLSIVEGCRIAGCRIRQISPHSTREQVASALAEPGVRVAFVHEYFLPVLAEPDEGVEVIAVTPLSLFPGSLPALRGGRRHQSYHQWLTMQEERDAPLRAKRGRTQAADSAAISSNAVVECGEMLASLTRAAAAQQPPEGGASPRSEGTPETD